MVGLHNYKNLHQSQYLYRTPVVTKPSLKRCHTIRVLFFAFLTLAVHLGILSIHPLYAMKASVWVNPAIVDIDQTVTLTLSLDAENPNLPDFSVLTKNFRILKKHNSSSISQSGGSILLKKEWVLVLLPLKKGNLTIPSIQIGNESTPPVSLKVINPKQVKKTDQETGNANHFKADPDVQASNNNAVDQKGTSTRKTTLSDDDIIIKVSITPEKAYVQSQLVLTQKIFHAVPLKSADLQTPVIEDNAADIIPLSEMKPYYWKLNGKRYHVIERNYAVFPKHSGSLSIAPTRFSGEAKIKTPDKDDPFGIKTKTHIKKVTSSADGLEVHINPREKEFSANNWLPAKNITINRKWSKPIEHIEPGDSVTLQTIIVADGLRAQQLPETYLQLPAKIKAYPKPAELSNSISQNGITGVWQQETTLIPSESGKFDIPEVQLPWWNITTKREEIATLPKQVVFVRKSASSVTENTLDRRDNTDKQPDTTTEPKQDSISNSKTHHDDDNQSNTRYGLYGVLATLLFLSFFFHRKKTAQNKTGRTQTNSKKLDQQQLLEELKQACLDNNPEKVEPLLLHWAKQIAKIQPATLEGILHSNRGYLRPEISRLSKALYSQTKPNWKGLSLWDAIKKYPYPEGTLVNTKIGPLKSLYPK